MFSAIFMLSLLVFALPCFAQENLADKTITLDVENMSIEMVLKMIAEQSGLNVVISKSVVGEITVKLDLKSFLVEADGVVGLKLDVAGLFHVGQVERAAVGPRKTWNQTKKNPSKPAAFQGTLQRSGIIRTRADRR